VQYVGGPVYCLAILGFKVSLLASYLRVAGFNRSYRLVLNVAIALVTANQVIYAFLLSFACHPVRPIQRSDNRSALINDRLQNNGIPPFPDTVSIK